MYDRVHSHRNQVWCSNFWEGPFSIGNSRLNYLFHAEGYYFKSWLSLSLSKNILLSYETRRFITVFTQARHWTLSWVSWIQFAPSIPVSIRPILMISSHLRLGHDINTASGNNENQEWNQRSFGQRVVASSWAWNIRRLVSPFQIPVGVWM
jgi:hypothetical protein